MNDLNTLRPEVAQALGFIERNQKYGDGSVCAGDIDIIRAELLRLAGDLNAARLSSETFEAKYQCMRERAERAEAELAALKARIADSPIASLVYGQGDLLAVISAENLDDWAGKRVRLVAEE